MSWGQPRSLQARQLLAASLGLVAFLALAGYALDRAFLRNRRKQPAPAPARATRWPTPPSGEFARNGEFIPPYEPVDPRFDRPGSGLYAEVVLPNGHWDSPSAQGPTLPDRRRCSSRSEETLRRPAADHRDRRPAGEVYRYGRGLIWSADGDAARRIPVHHLHPRRHHRAEPPGRACSAQALWRYLGGAGLILLLLQAVILRWSLRPLRRVIDELKRVQRGAGLAHERTPPARTRTADRKHQRLHRERAREPRPPAQHAGRPRAQPEDAAGGAARAPGRPTPPTASCARKSTRRCGA